jgi:hypothetical protein
MLLFLIVIIYCCNKKSNDTVAINTTIKPVINYSNDYKQKLEDIALEYIKNINYIKLNDEDISVLVEIKLKENSNTTIEQLWTETEQELKDTIHNLIKNKENFEYTRKKEMDDLENQLKEIKKQSLINNLKQQGKRKTPFV